MFIGDLVKLKSDTTRSSDRDKSFVQNAIQNDWIWLITSIDGESLDYTIQPLYLDSECGGNMTQLGGELQVLYDEIEVFEIDRDELFNTLKRQEM